MRQAMLYQPACRLTLFAYFGHRLSLVDFPRVIRPREMADEPLRILHIRHSFGQLTTPAAVSLLTLWIHLPSSYLTRSFILAMQFTTVVIMMTVFVISAVDAAQVPGLDFPSDPLYGFPGKPHPVSQVTFDTVYDDANLPLTRVACSTGANGLINKGVHKLGDLISFPYVGGASFASFNSTKCGTCWELVWPPVNQSVFVFVVDNCEEGFNISKEAMNLLTDGEGLELGVVEGVTAAEAGTALCGFYV